MARAPSCAHHGAMEDSWELGESRHLTRERTGVPREGTAVGDYLLLRRLGSGAMGTVYVGRHRETAIEHAVKIVDRLTPGSSRRARFEREAAALSRLSHPGVIRVHQFGIQETVGYFSMDLVEGTPLDELVEAGPLPKAEALRIAGAIAEALAHLHAAGITHRDLKPANVLIRTDDGAPVLVDFGLARVAEDARLTQSAQLVGTPRYMAPEQILGEQEQVGPATDVFALGVLLCELLGGELPFRGSDLVSLASNIVRGEPELPADLEPALRSLLLGLLAKAPPNRPTAAWAADACARLARGETVRIRNAFPWRRFLAGASVVGSLSLLVAAALWTKGSPAPPPPRPSLAGAGAIVQTASAPASPPRAP
ncbi:MAG: serine/threonine protein kinase, partial [Planctomycetota bacterium]